MIGSASTAGHVVLVSKGSALRDGHERATRIAIARRIAALMGCEFAGEHDASLRYPMPLYFVPDDTLLREHSLVLGIAHETDFFGGVVPYRFVATKAISHSAVDPPARVPTGWSPRLGERLAHATLRGFSAFALADARTAAMRLLPYGSVRIKPAHVSGGGGQRVVDSADETEHVLSKLDAEAMREHGVVIEQNLEEATTYSVGRIRVADTTISYHGTQQVTRNHRGHEVYGGSELMIVRGSFDDLLRLDIDAATRAAIGKAVEYDAVAALEFEGFLASRRNYDVVLGRDREGRAHCGVLEQSWRIGGASAAEVAALEAFKDDPELDVVRASTREMYSAEEPPANANIHFRGHDEHVGFLTKYSTIDRNGNQA